MTQSNIILDEDIIREAKVLVLTSYCYTHDDCDTQCKLYQLCHSNLKSGDMGLFKKWPTTDLNKGLHIINGSVHICYRNVTDSITSKGATRLYGKILNPRRREKPKDAIITDETT